MVQPHKAGEPAPNRGQTYKAEVLTEAEVTAMISLCSRRAPTGIRNRALITLLWRTGLRISEILALRPVDVDLEGGTVRVLHGKGDKSRTVGIDPRTADTISRWLDARKKLGFRNGLLFRTLDGKPVHPQYVRNTLHRLARKAGIEKRVHPHGLRHTHAAEMVREGAPITTIRDDLGHSSLAVTDRYLRDIAPEAVINFGRQREWGE